MTRVHLPDRYDIQGLLAVGGMAEVYVAKRTEDDGSVQTMILKRLKPEMQQNESYVHMFQDEARLAERLQHPNIARVIDHGMLDGSSFIAFELLDGINARELIDALQKQQKRLSLSDALAIADGVLSALGAAHRLTDDQGRPLNVVHRDVSPQNVIVTWTGDVKLIDFGVAKSDERLHRTRPGLLKGKLPYMSPEQVCGYELDSRSDLFSFAALFYELLAVDHPFVAISETGADLLKNIVRSNPPSLERYRADCPHDLTAAIHGALAKRPAHRPETAAELLGKLLYGAAPTRPSTQTDLAATLKSLFENREALNAAPKVEPGRGSLPSSLTPEGLAILSRHSHLYDSVGELDLMEEFLQAADEVPAPKSTPEAPPIVAPPNAPPSSLGLWLVFACVIWAAVLFLQFGPGFDERLVTIDSVPSGLAVTLDDEAGKDRTPTTIAWSSGVPRRKVVVQSNAHHPCHIDVRAPDQNRVKYVCVMKPKGRE